MRSTAVFASCLLLVSSLTASAQVAEAPTAADVAALRAEVAELRAEIADLRATLRRTPATPSPQPAPPASEPLPGDSVRDEPRTPDQQARIRVYGAIVSNTVANAGEANWIENPNVALRAPIGSPEPGSFTSTLRQSRLGVAVSGAKAGGWDVDGRLSFDFLGGATGFVTGQVMGVPRLFDAVIRLSTDATTLVFGQEQMVLAPRNPTSVAAQAFPLLYRSGNLYLRVPQVSATRRLSGSRDGGRVVMTAAVTAPVSGDRASPFFEFQPLADSGERSKAPGVQSRLAWVRGSDDRRSELGVSGHYSRERVGSTTLESSVGAVDLDVQAGRLGFGGEAWFGKNLDAFGGGIGQEAQAVGGFAELRFGLSERLQLVGGYGFDHVSSDDRPLFAIEKNATAFGSLSYRFTPVLVGGVEYRWLTTTRRLTGERTLNHLNWVLAYRF